MAGAFVLAACGSSSASDDTTTTKAKGSEDSTTTTEKTSTTAAADDAGELSGSYIGTGIEGYEPVADSQLTIAFEDGQMSVNAGCNTLGAGYTFEDGTLKWDGPARATQMGCADDLMAQDTWLTELFTDGVEAVLDGDTLTLTSGEVVITLESVATAPITGTTWTLDGTIANDAVSSLPAGAEPPTLTIDEDGTAGVFAGCNSGSTTVEVAEATLTFGPIALTRMACEPDATMLENQVIEVLDGEVDYTVDGDTLTIMNGTSGLTYKAS